MLGGVYFGEVAPGQSAIYDDETPQPATFTANILADLAPWMDPAGSFEAYNTALGAMFEQIFSIVVPQGSPDEPASYVAGWGSLLDPSICPDEFLPYCGQFVGVQIPPGTAPVAARNMILSEANFQTGTTTAITAAAQMWLSGTQQVSILERQDPSGATDPYSLVVIVKPEQVLSLSALTAAVLAVKPVGVQVSIVQSDWAISQIETAYSSVGAVESAFSSVGNAEADVT